MGGGEALGVEAGGVVQRIDEYPQVAVEMGLGIGQAGQLLAFGDYGLGVELAAHSSDPPSTGQICPVTKDARSEASSATTQASSSGVAKGLPTKVIRWRIARCSSFDVSGLLVKKLLSGWNRLPLL